MSFPDHRTADDHSALARIAELFRQLHRLSLTQYPSYPALYADYLQTGLRLLAMDVGIVSRIEQDSYVVLAAHPPRAGIAAGDLYPLSDTYCSEVVRTGATVAIEDLAQNPQMRAHPAYQSYPHGAYVAAPIPVDGGVAGTLNFTRTQPRCSSFSEAEVELVELMARSLGQVIERDLLERQREEANRRVQENAELFESAFRYAAIGIALVGTDGRWLRVNHAVTEILGYSEAELLNVDFQTITHPDDLDTDLHHVQEMLDGTRDTYRMEKRYRHRNGHIVWVLLSVSLVRSATGEPLYFISQIQDISARKHGELELERKRQELEDANSQLKELAMIDPLTRLLNRRAFSERLSAELHHSGRTGMPMSLLLLDVDHFKAFNDQFGHPAGDRALQRIAEALSAAARVSDVVARFGGEEFTLVLPNTDAAGCQVVAERLRVAVDAISGLERAVTISVGGASFEPSRHGQPPVDPKDIIREADGALYAAKAAGRNTCRHAA